MTESIEPTEAVELYISDRTPELADSSIYAHRSHLNHFIEWCGEVGIDDMSSIAPLSIKRYAAWRRENGNPNTVTMNTQLSTIRVFINWCESAGIVGDGLADAIHVPSLAKGEDERSEMLDSDVADRIIDYLSKYQYATREHVVVLLMWRGLLRRGAIRAIDIDDAYLTGDEPGIELRHRPETGTPLKNQYDANRYIALQSETASVIADYIEEHRTDVADKYGREPLITTTQGRPHVSTLQADAYATTRPCVAGSGCPHDRDPEECTAATMRKEAYDCPSSLSPHAIRRGGITHWLRSDVPDTVVSDRASTSPEVLDRHYDERTEREKAEQRRKFLDSI